jgi:hypothetical protein
MNANKSQNAKRNLRRIPLAILAAAVLLWTLPALAGSKTIVTSWDMGIVKWLDYGDYTFPAGNMHIQGHSGINLHLSEDPGHTGLMYWVMNLQFDENGDGVANITWRLEVGEFGKFEYDDAGNVVLGEYIIDLFTPNGSVWEGNAHSGYYGDTVATDGVGHGVAGAADGLQVQTDSQALRSDTAVLQIITRLDPKSEK